MQLAPSERFNVFVGDNGQGKTSVLEAIYAVAALRSFRTSRLADMIAFGAAQARLGARVLKDDLVRVYEVEIAAGSRRVRLDGKAARPLARYFGGFNVVVFTPEDLALPRGSPGERRRFLDRAVFNLRPEFLVVAQDYEKVLKQRNSVLRSALERGTSPDELLAVYDEQLAPFAVAVADARAAYVGELREELARSFEAIGRSTHRATIRYESATAGARVDDVLEKLRAGRARDLASGATQHGPHRDNLAFELDGRDAGSVASQGQLRALVLAWKIAELSLLAHVRGDAPILLLDDVSSELDPSRNAYLFEHVAKLAGQCFITTTRADHVLLTSERRDYELKNGRISS